jgi:hypothetical protein
MVRGLQVEGSKLDGTVPNQEGDVNEELGRERDLFEWER